MKCNQIVIPHKDGKKVTRHDSWHYGNAPAPEGSEICNGALVVTVTAEDDNPYGRDPDCVVSIRIVCMRCEARHHPKNLGLPFYDDDSLGQFLTGFVIGYMNSGEE